MGERDVVLAVALLRVTEMVRVTVLPFRAPSRWLLTGFGSSVMRRMETVEPVSATIAICKNRTQTPGKQVDK